MFQVYHFDRIDLSLEDRIGWELQLERISIWKEEYQVVKKNLNEIWVRQRINVLVSNNINQAQQ